MGEGKVRVKCSLDACRCPPPTRLFEMCSTATLSRPAREPCQPASSGSRDPWRPSSKLQPSRHQHQTKARRKHLSRPRPVASLPSWPSEERQGVSERRRRETAGRHGGRDACEGRGGHRPGCYTGEIYLNTCIACGWALFCNRSCTGAPVCLSGFVLCFVLLH